MKAALLVGLVVFCSLWTFGSFLQCSNCQSSTSYDDCQSQVTLTNCSANQSCFQTDIQLVKGADNITGFQKGCVNSGLCDEYSRGEIVICISRKGQGYTGDCQGKCCDGDNCNSENLLPDKGSFLQCSNCQSSTSYDDCQSQVTLTNCSANQSCFQTDIQLIKGADKKTFFQKGCLNSGLCDAYNRGEIENCITHKGQGYTGDCKGKCCDGDNCNNENLLPDKGKNKGSVFIISVMVLLSGVLLTVVNIN